MKLRDAAKAYMRDLQMRGSNERCNEEAHMKLIVRGETERCYQAMIMRGRNARGANKVCKREMQIIDAKARCT